MASNDVEVLDPAAATVEKLREFVSERKLNRRNFIAAVGVAGAAAGTGLVSTRSAEGQQPTNPNGYAQVDVLNLMLNIKYLKATLYAYITTGKDIAPATGVTTGAGVVLNAPAQITFSTQQITDMFNEMYYDELNQLIALRNLIGVAVAGRQSVNLLGSGLLPAPPATTTLTQNQAVALSRMLEDLSVSAFTTASIYLTGTNLAFANQALASDGFHAGAVRLVAIQTGAPYLSPQSSAVATTTTTTVFSFSGSLTTGNPIIYAFLLTNIPAVGSILSGIGIPAGSGAAVTAVTNTANAAITGVAVSGSPIINTVSNVTGLAAGQPITGTFIPALSYIKSVGTNSITISANASGSSTVAPTGIVTSGSPTVTGVSSLTGVLAGQPITGTGIPAGTTITTASGTTITMSANATASSVVKPTGVLTSGSAIINSVSSLTGLINGQPITGTGIPAGATIVSSSGTTVQMSANATANSVLTTAYSFTAFTVAASNVVTPTGSFNGLVVGQAVTGPGIPAGTTIVKIDTATVTLSNNATVTSTATPTGITTAGSQTITGVSSIAGLVVGQVISGPGIPSVPLTTINAASGTTITLSSAATATVTTAVTFSSPSVVTLATTTGAALSSPTTETVTIPATEALSVGLAQVVMAGNATATGINTIGTILADSMDVAPADPGTAALAAAGPAATPGISPAIYQGFFNTAGAATSSANTPAGFAFVRSFQQILAVLYDYNPTTLGNSTQNFSGGFYPYGVSGPINSVT